MNSRRLAFALAVVAGGALLWFRVIGHNRRSPQGQLGVEKVGFQVGERAPDFTLRSPDGTSITLSALRGEPVVLNFWATWCAPCRVEMPWLVQLDETYRARGVQIIGVALESGSNEEVAAFARERGVQYRIVMGNSTTADEYGGVRFMPQSLFIGRDGTIIKAITGLTDKKEIEDSIKALLASNSSAQLARGGQP